MRRRRSAQLVTGINITPLTDIALELLIVFMIATPMLMQSSMQVNLPKTVTGDELKDTTITIFINEKERITVNKQQVSAEELSTMLLRLLKQHPESPVVINADKNIPYNTVIHVLDVARQSGAKKFSLGIEKKSL